MKIVLAKSQKEILDNVFVRGLVFVVEQEIDWEIEFDGLDNECILFTVYNDDKPVGAARLYKSKVGRVATLKEYRKQGVATLIMNGIEKYALNHSIKILTLNAQLHVKEFYLHLGYIPQGETFLEADIEHIKMIKEIK